jgi:hypothetical protein
MEKSKLRFSRNLALALAGIALSALLILLSARPKPSPPRFDADEAYSAIQTLTGPEFEGRMTGAPGNQKAMAFVAAKFREMGLRPFANTGDYFQSFQAYVPELLSVPTLEVLKEGRVVKHYVQYADFRETFRGYSRPGEVVGKGVICHSPYPLPNAMESIVLYDNLDHDKLDESALIKLGAKGLLLKAEEKSVVVRSVSTDYQVLDTRAGLVKFAVTGFVMGELERFIASGCTIRMKSDFTMKWVPTANVAGFLPAADGRVDDVEVISCHLDHLGLKVGGGYFPGALDNASGTGVMLSLARAISANRSRLAKAFVFVAFNAEEEYLGGSWHLVVAPPLVPQKVEVLNFDMVGSKDPVPLKLDSAILSPREDFQNPIVADSEEKIKDVAERMGLSIQIDRKSKDGADHIPFACRLIPAITFIHFAEGDYHTVHDTITTIDKNRLAEVGRLALGYLAESAFRRPLEWLLTLLCVIAATALLGALIAEIFLRRSRRGAGGSGRLPRRRAPRGSRSLCLMTRILA